MPSWSSIRTLSRRRWALLFRAALVLAVVRAVLWAFPFGRARGCIDRLTRRPVLVGECRADVAWAVSAAARRLLGTRCLARALALHALLRQAGIPSELRIGVSRMQAGLLAHAWVECDGVALADGVDSTQYQALPSLAR